MRKKTFKEIVNIAGTKYEIKDENVFRYYYQAKYGAKHGRESVYLKDGNTILGVRFGNPKDKR